MTTQTSNSLADIVGAWKLNTEKTSVSFRTRAVLVMRAKGTLRATRGSAVVGANGHVTGEIVLDPSTIDTKIEKRDSHLRSADFFDVDGFPDIVFTVTEIRSASNNKYLVVGNLAIHGRSVPVSVTADIELAQESVTLSAEVAVTKSILGMKKANLIQSWVTVNAYFERDRSHEVAS